jgi:hypothetical protein
MKGRMEFKTTQVLAFADDTAIISRSLSGATETYVGRSISKLQMDIELKQIRVLI